MDTPLISSPTGHRRIWAPTDARRVFDVVLVVLASAGLVGSVGVLVWIVPVALADDTGQSAFGMFLAAAYVPFFLVATLSAVLGLRRRQFEFRVVGWVSLLATLTPAPLLVMVCGLMVIT